MLNQQNNTKRKAGQSWYVLIALESYIKYRQPLQSTHKQHCIQITTYIKPDEACNIQVILHPDPR